MRAALLTLMLTLMLSLVLPLAIAAPACAQDGDPTDNLPPGVVARVHGRNVTATQLLERLAQTYEGTERGRKVLEQLVDDLCVSNEASRRSISVSQTEIDEYLTRWDERIKTESRGKASLQDLYAEASSRAEFIDTAREYLLRQKMAKQDLGSKPEEELSEHYIKLWLGALRRKQKVRYSELANGALAAVGDRTVDRFDLARELRAKLPPEMVSAVRSELVVAAATEHRLAEAGVVVTDADIEESLKGMRERFAKDPQVKGTGVTFDQFLQKTKGIGEADLQRDPVFRARIGLRRMLSAQVGDADVRTHWEANRERYGERVALRHIFIPAAVVKPGDEGFGIRTFRDAWNDAMNAKVDVLAAAGFRGKDETGAKVPLAPIVTRVAKRMETDAEKRKAAGEPSVWTRLTVKGQSDLERAVFEGEIGALLGPIRTDVGYFLLVVDERRPAPAFAEVKSVIRDELVQTRIEQFQINVRADEGVIVRKEPK